MKYLLTVLLIILITSGCKRTFNAEADEAPIVYDGCEPSGDALCLNGLPASRVTADGQMVGLINVKSGFIHHHRYVKSNIHNTGEINGNNIFFQGDDCAGDAYARYAGVDPYSLLIPVLLGELFEWNGALYYYPPGTDTFYKFESYSYYRYHPATGRVCTNTASGGIYLHIKLLPNNPSVTGIQNYPFLLPVEIMRERPVTIIIP